MIIDVKHLVNLLHFPDMNPNSYDINNMKFDLNLSVYVRFIAND